jgi:hypothetical protein
MNEVRIEDIDNFMISELSQYFFGMSNRSLTIAHKKIGDLGTGDLLHLLRRRCYTDIAALLAIREIETNGFYGHSFNYDERSLAQQDMLKELLLLPDYFWDYNQRSYHKLKPIAEKYSMHANLPENTVAQFLQFDPGPIIWTESDINQISYYLAMGALGLFLTALNDIRQLKRAIDEGIKVTLDWEGNTIEIKNAADIKEHIIPLFLGEEYEEFDEVLDKEVKIWY